MRFYESGLSDESDPGRPGRVRGYLAYSLAPPAPRRPTEADIARHAERVARDLERLGHRGDAIPPDAPESIGRRHAARYGPGKRKHDYAAILAIFDEDPSRGFRTIAAIYRLRTGLDADLSIVRRVVRRERGERPRLGSTRDNPRGGRAA